MILFWFFYPSCGKCVYVEFYYLSREKHSNLARRYTAVFIPAMFWD
jgi:hypothetical protein